MQLYQYNQGYFFDFFFVAIIVSYLPANVRLDEDVLKTSWRRLTSSSSEDAFKASLRRLDQDEYIRLGGTLSRCFQDVLKTSSKRCQDVLPRCLQDVLETSCKNVFKTSSKNLKDVLRTYWRHFQNVLARHLEDVF